MGHYRTAPTYDQPMVIGDKTSSVYYRWFQDLDVGSPPSSETPVTVGASPFTYSPKVKGNLIVSGGTVTNVLISRSGTFYSTGATQGLFNLAANDQIQIVYSGLPTAVFLPT